MDVVFSCLLLLLLDNTSEVIAVEEWVDVWFVLQGLHRVRNISLSVDLELLQYSFNGKFTNMGQFEEAI